MPLELGAKKKTACLAGFYTWLSFKVPSMFNKETYETQDDDEVILYSSDVCFNRSQTKLEKVHFAVKIFHTDRSLLLSWCFTSTETIRLIWDGRMEVGEEYVSSLSSW